MYMSFTALDGPFPLAIRIHAVRERLTASLLHHIHISRMESLPQDLQALLSKVLPKIFIAIDGLSSLRDVPNILEHMVLRLTILEYAMSVWRQAQSPNCRGISHSPNRSSPSHRSRYPDSSLRWRLLFSDKHLFFLFKDVLLNSSKQLSESGNAHIYTEAASLRHASGLGMYELSAAPARAVLRKILESSLRTLIEALVLSNAAKYGTWQDVRLPNTPPLRSSGYSGPTSQDTRRDIVFAPQAIPGPDPTQSSRVRSFEATQTFQLLDTTQAVDAFDVHRSISYAAQSWLNCPSSNSGSTRLYLDHIKAANDLLMQRGLPLDYFVCTSAQMSFSIQKSGSGRTSSPKHWHSVSGRHLSTSTTFFITDLDAAAEIVRLGLSKVQATPATRQKIARLLVRLFAKGSGISISMHESKEGHYVRLQPVGPRQIEISASRLQFANTGALTSLIELANSTESRNGIGASENLFRTLLQLCVSVSPMNGDGF